MTLMMAVGIAVSYKPVVQAKMLSRNWTRSSRYGYIPSIYIHYFPKY